MIYDTTRRITNIVPVYEYCYLQESKCISVCFLRNFENLHPIFRFQIQGYQSGCFLGFDDTKTKVVFQYMLLLLGCKLFLMLTKPREHSFHSTVKGAYTETQPLF